MTFVPLYILCQAPFLHFILWCMCLHVVYPLLQMRIPLCSISGSYHPEYKIDKDNDLLGFEWDLYLLCSMSCLFYILSNFVVCALHIMACIVCMYYICCKYKSRVNVHIKNSSFHFKCVVLTASDNQLFIMQGIRNS